MYDNFLITVATITGFGLWVYESQKALNSDKSDILAKEVRNSEENSKDPVDKNEENEKTLLEPGLEPPKPQDIVATTIPIKKELSLPPGPPAVPIADMTLENRVEVEPAIVTPLKSDKEVNARSEIRWLKCKGKQIPDNAIVGGKEANGKPIYIARTSFKGSIIPGKAGAHVNGCRVSFGGKEIETKDFEVLVWDADISSDSIVDESSKDEDDQIFEEGFTVEKIPRVPVHWQKCEKGQVPAKAIAAGQEPDGNKLYIARGSYENGVHIGKVGKHLNGCLIPYGWKEIQLNDYEILVEESR